MPKPITQPQKTLGIIGGISPASTLTYYREINRLVNEACGGHTSAPLILYSVNFDEIVADQQRGDWEHAGQTFSHIAQKLIQAGADGILIAANTMHKVAPMVAQAISVPLLHIAHATADAILNTVAIQHIQAQTGEIKIALLGTAFVMQQDFYKDELAQRGITTIVPNQQDQAEIHRIIFEELTFNKILPQSKAFYLSVIDDLMAQGASGVILGCTEIGLLIQQSDREVAFFDTAKLHAQMAADFILTKSE